MTNKVIDQLRKRFYGKKVLIIGLGLQGGGVGLVKFFNELGTEVTVTDLKDKEQLKDSIEKIKDLNVKLVLGKHRLINFLKADIIFKGPSVPWSLPELLAAQKKGIPIEMELSFFTAHCSAKIIGITGSRGKSTTTQLIYQLLKNSNFNVYLAGSVPNISTISMLKKVKSGDWVVMELPSWPLSGFHKKKFSPHIAVFTNFYPDHLNYYGNMNNYLFDKKAIYLYQKPEDFFIVNKNLKKIILKDSIKSKVIYFTSSDFPSSLKYLKGDHNLENASAVWQVAKVLNLNLDKAVGIISNFKGLPYRLERIAKNRGIAIINDTTSTTPIATIKAIDTFSNKNIVLILGGNSKHLPYNELLNKLKIVKKIVLLEGTFTREILPKLKQKYPEKITAIFSDLRKAFINAYGSAKSINNQVYILFSPGATSFAMFKNEFHRGQEFNRIVREKLKCLNENNNS